MDPPEKRSNGKFSSGEFRANLPFPPNATQPYFKSMNSFKLLANERIICQTNPHLLFFAGAAIFNIFAVAHYLLLDLPHLGVSNFQIPLPFLFFHDDFACYLCLLPRLAIQPFLPH